MRRVLLGTNPRLNSTTSYTGEVPISHNELEASRKYVAAAAESAPAIAGGGDGGGGAAGASVAFCLRPSSFNLFDSLVLCNLICGYNCFAVEVSYSMLLLLYEVCLITAVSCDIDTCEVDLSLIEDDAAAAI